VQCYDQKSKMAENCMYGPASSYEGRSSITAVGICQVIRAFVMSDYCNGVLAGLDQLQTDLLQSVLNTAARILGGRYCA